MSTLPPEQSDKRKLSAIDGLLGGLVKSAKTVSLYHQGHPAIQQILERALNILQTVIGTEENLLLDIKAKSVLAGDTEIPSSSGSAAFASALHLLGIGQILFTKRMTAAGMGEFFKILNLKPDEKNTLTDLQKAVQNTRIDGMQMTFVLNFVVVDQNEAAKQKPGHLTEEQIQAFLASPNLPDFLHRLLKQNEPLAGKDAEAITDLIDNVLHGDIPAEKFAEAMPWTFYDPRIRGRWEAFASGLSTKPDSRWDKGLLVSDLCVFSASELDSMKSYKTYEKADAVLFSLDRLHAIMARPSNDGQAKSAANAYARVLVELGRDGQVGLLLKEFDLWSGFSKGPMAAAWANLQKQIQEKVASPAFAKRLIEHLASVAADGEEIRKIQDLVAAMGAQAAAFLLDGTRELADKATRGKLCALLAAVCRKVGTGPLIRALSDEDWFLVSNAAAILGDAAGPESVKSVAPLLRHAHERVRTTAVRVLAKYGGEDAVAALVSHIAGCPNPEEASQSVIALSLIAHPGIDKRLAELYDRNKDDRVRIAVLTALGRVGATKESTDFLASVARRTWLEIFTGRRRELSKAARHALERAHKEEKR